MVDFSRSFEEHFPAREYNFSSCEDDVLFKNKDFVRAQRIGEMYEDCFGEVTSDREQARVAAVFGAPFDEHAPSVRADGLLQEVLRCRQLAREYDLFELETQLSKMLQALNGDTPAHLESQRSICANILDLKEGVVKSWDGETLRKEYANYISKLGSMLKTGYDGCGSCRDFIRLIGSTGNFDIQHMIQLHTKHMVQLTQTAWSSAGSVNVATLEQELETGNPLSALRNKEDGYKSALTKANGCMSAEEAGALAKKAFHEKYVWTAELWWKRAANLDTTNAKHFSNLAMLYIKIGRYLRSIEVGYRGLATRYLEKAVDSAKKGIAADPLWERSYQRGAEAYFALGFYERALDALKFLKPIFCQEGQLLPSDRLIALRAKAKANATAWLSLRAIPGKTSIAETIELSLENLRKVVVQSFPLGFKTDKLLPPSKQIATAGDTIVGALNVTLGALQLMYTKRLEWEAQCRNSNALKIRFQMELRAAAKVVPLQILVHSEKLRKMAFAEDPIFSLWGMDRCDRMNVEMLPFNAKDPCEHDGEDTEELDELLHRHTDRPVMSHTLAFCKDMIDGKHATSFDCDMANHHLCAFTMTLLDRLILSDQYPDLRLKATKRVIQLSQNSNALLMGGEFLGKVIKVVSGLDAFRTEAKDTSQFFRFIALEGGLSTISREICVGGDLTGDYQTLLCKLTPQHMINQSKRDVECLLYDYALCALDGYYEALDNDQTLEHVKIIISNILMSDKSLETLPCLATSSFGQYLMRSLTKFCASMPDPNTTVSIGEAVKWTAEFSAVVPAAVDKWSKMKYKKKSSHRWNAMSAEQQTRLQDMKPLSKVERFEEALKNGRKKKKGNSAVSALMECSQCKSIIDLEKCPCNLVYYCSKECQRKHWKVHKAIHKKAMKCSMAP